MMVQRFLPERGEGWERVKNGHRGDGEEGFRHTDP